jgi:hypothetical protein
MGKEKFKDPRWNQMVGGKVVGYRDITPEEEQQAHQDTEEILKSMGVKLKRE